MNGILFSKSSGHAFANTGGTSVDDILFGYDPVQVGFIETRLHFSKCFVDVSNPAIPIVIPKYDFKCEPDLLTIPLGSGVAQWTAVPPGTLAYVDDKLVAAVTDGVFEFASEQDGDFIIRFEHPVRYMSREWVIHAE